MPVPYSTSAVLPELTSRGMPTQLPAAQLKISITGCWPFANWAAATPWPLSFSENRPGATGVITTGLLTAPEGVLMVMTTGPPLAVSGISALICEGPAKNNGSEVCTPLASVTVALVPAKVVGSGSETAANEVAARLAP